VEALDLAVRAWTVRLRLQVSDAVASEKSAEEATAGVGPGVVGHQPLRGDPVRGVEGEHALAEGDDGWSALV
jgi:hypothetical protein